MDSLSKPARLSIDIPVADLKKLKHLAIDSDSSVRDIVMAAVAAYLSSDAVVFAELGDLVDDSTEVVTLDADPVKASYPETIKARNRQELADLTFGENNEENE